MSLGSGRQVWGFIDVVFTLGIELLKRLMDRSDPEGNAGSSVRRGLGLLDGLHNFRLRRGDHRWRHPASARFRTCTIIG